MSHGLFDLDAVFRLEILLDQLPLLLHLSTSGADDLCQQPHVLLARQFTPGVSGRGTGADAVGCASRRGCAATAFGALEFGSARGQTIRPEHDRICRPGWNRARCRASGWVQCRLPESPALISAASHPALPIPGHLKEFDVLKTSSQDAVCRFCRRRAGDGGRPRQDSVRADRRDNHEDHADWCRTSRPSQPASSHPQEHIGAYKARQFGRISVGRRHVS